MSNVFNPPSTVPAGRGSAPESRRMAPPAGTPAAGTPAAVTALVSRWIDAVEQAVVGKRAVLELIATGLVANGHILLDDLPGVAKTLSARSFAATASMDFARVQFTPDILPADITGAMVLDLTSNTARFSPGPIFAQLVLADEINRAPAKAQAALLEGMQERQVTVDGVTHPLPAPFLVIATQNPVETEGTYPLPEAQLDRFILRARIGYPAAKDESRLLAERLRRKTDDFSLQSVMTSEQFLGAQRAVEQVHVEQAIVDYVVAIVRLGARRPRRRGRRQSPWQPRPAQARRASSVITGATSSPQTTSAASPLLRSPTGSCSRQKRGRVHRSRHGDHALRLQRGRTELVMSSRLRLDTRR
ncbi:MAG: AAA family ATPase [Ilumatobacteraceae bacterium]